MRTKMHIFVQTLSGKTIVLDVARSDTVHKVKTKIQDMQPVHADHQRLSFGGKPLLDYYTMADYDIDDGAMVDLTIVIHGGALPWGVQIDAEGWMTTPVGRSCKATSPSIAQTGGVVVEPVLAHHVSRMVLADASIMKEERKILEPRSLLPGQKSEKGGGEGGAGNK